MKSLVILLILFPLDQILKYLAFSGKMFFWLNRGMILGLFPGYGYFSVIVYIFLTLGAFWWVVRTKPKSAHLILGLLLTGGLSNSLDRFTYGGVIDYLPLVYTYVNISDLSIIASLLFLSYHIINKNQIPRTK